MANDFTTRKIIIENIDGLDFKKLSAQAKCFDLDKDFDRSAALLDDYIRVRADVDDIDYIDDDTFTIDHLGLKTFTDGAEPNEYFQNLLVHDVELLQEWLGQESVEHHYSSCYGYGFSLDKVGQGVVIKLQEEESGSYLPLWNHTQEQQKEAFDKITKLPWAVFSRLMHSKILEGASVKSEGFEDTLSDVNGEILVFSDYTNFNWAKIEERAENFSLARLSEQEYFNSPSRFLGSYYYEYKTGPVASLISQKHGNVDEWLQKDLLQKVRLLRSWIENSEYDDTVYEKLGSGASRKEQGKRVVFAAHQAAIPVQEDQKAWHKLSSQQQMQAYNDYMHDNYQRVQNAPHWLLLTLTTGKILTRHQPGLTVYGHCVRE